MIPSAAKSKYRLPSRVYFRADLCLIYLCAGHLLTQSPRCTSLGFCDCDSFILLAIRMPIFTPFLFAYAVQLLTAHPAKCQALSLCLWLALLSIYLVKGLHDPARTPAPALCSSSASAPAQGNCINCVSCAACVNMYIRMQ